MDKLAPERRSANMRAIRAGNTRPELTVRRTLRNIGLTGYRLHRGELPGKPDVVFVGRKKAILVHGCFWHGHDCPEGLRRPLSRRDYWLPKISGNQARDARYIEGLTALGWSVLIVWECECSAPTLASRLASFMGVPNS
jgi:DNA mismatch endonuclease (patch repair protein)